MEALELSSKKVTKQTSKEISLFIYENKELLTNELKMFYQDVKSFIDRECKKPSIQRMEMNKILEMAYNIESYILNSGALSCTTIFV